jgi:hypothetical protein
VSIFIILKFSRDKNSSLRLPSIMSNPKFTKAGTVSPFIEKKNYKGYNVTKTVHIRKLSKIDLNKSLDNRSVRFTPNQASNDSQFKKLTVLPNEEKLTPLDRKNKELQNQFVAMCDKDNQFVYSNSNLSRQSFKYYLQRRYCKNIVEKLLNFMNYPQTSTFGDF